MVIGPAVWIGAVLLVLMVAGACVASYWLCRRMLKRELAAMRRLLETRLAAAAEAVPHGADNKVVTLHPKAVLKQERRAAYTTPITVRIRKRTPGTVPDDHAVVIVAGALALAHGRAGLDMNPVEVSAQPSKPGNGSWVQQGRTLVHAGRNVPYRPAPQASLSIVGQGHGNGEGKGEAAD
jgi:hypothetical protein